MNIYTTATAARILKCSPRTVRRIALAHGIGQGTRDWIFTASDIKLLKMHIHDKAGRPKLSEASKA